MRTRVLSRFSIDQLSAGPRDRRVRVRRCRRLGDFYSAVAHESNAAACGDRSSAVAGVTDRVAAGESIRCLPSERGDGSNVRRRAKAEACRRRGAAGECPGPREAGEGGAERHGRLLTRWNDFQPSKSNRDVSTGKMERSKRSPHDRGGPKKGSQKSAPFVKKGKSVGNPSSVEYNE